MKSFASLGNEEIAIVSVTGGIAEALIATACGLGIAIFALVPFNFSRLECLTSEFGCRRRNVLKLDTRDVKKLKGTNAKIAIPRPQAVAISGFPRYRP